MRRLLLLPSLVVLGFGLASAQSRKVRIVDSSVFPPPAGTFSSIQDAVDQASEGDLLFLKPGEYRGFTVSGKSLVIEGAGVGQVVVSVSQQIGIEGPVIDSLGANQSVVMRGLTVQPSVFGPDPFNALVNVDDCAGAVLFEDCALTHYSGEPLRVSNSASVTIQRCVLDAGFAFINTICLAEEQCGLVVLDGSTAYVYDSTITGSVGSDAGPGGPFCPQGVYSPGNGGDAVVLRDSTIYFSGSTIVAGDGGSAATLSSPCFPGPHGGDAVRTAGSSLIRYADTSFTAGLGGPTHPSCGLPNGPDGQVFNLTPTSVVEPIAGDRRSFRMDGFVTEGQDVTTIVDGLPGDDVLLYWSLYLRPGLYFPTLGTALHLKGKPNVISMGILPASGSRAVEITTPILPPLVEFATIVAQPLFFAPTGEFYHAGPSHLVILDTRF